MRQRSGVGGRQSLSSALPEDLPPGWVRVESRSKPGAFYYAHPATGRTQVEKPVDKEKNARQKAFAAIVGSQSASAPNRPPPRPEPFARASGSQSVLAAGVASVARKPERQEASAPIVASAARKPERHEADQARQPAMPLVVLDEGKGPVRRDSEVRRAEEEARRKKAEETRKAEEEARRRKAEEQARKQAEEAEAEEAAQEELRQKAMERRTAREKAVQAAAEKEDADGKGDTPLESQPEEEQPKVSVSEIRRATMQKDWTRRKQEKKKAWIEEADSDEDDAEVTQEDIVKWREDEERREREAIEAKRRAKEEEERRILEEKLEKERKIREAEEEQRRQEEEEERRIVEEALEKARLKKEKEEEKRRQKEEEERRRQEEALERARKEAEMIEAKRRQKEEEERILAEVAKETARLQAEQEEAMRRQKEEEELKRQEEALERARREAEHRDALRKQREEVERKREEQVLEAARTPSMGTGTLEPEAKRQCMGEDFGAHVGGDKATGVVIWYNGRRRCGVIARDWDGKRLRIATGGAPNGGLAPPVPGGLMHGTRVSFSLAGSGPGQDPVCFDVMPMEGQAGLSCGGDSQAGCRYRNEDRTVAVDLPDGLGHIVGLFDGHRGTTCADFLSQNLSKSIVAKVQEAFNQWLIAGRAILSLSIDEEVEAIRSGLVAAFEDCDRNFLSSAQHYGWGDGASAMVALVAHGFEAPEPGKSTVFNAMGGQAKCFVAWCGLGRVLLLRARQTVRVTRDHTCADDEEYRRLESLGALLLQDPRGVWWMGRPDRLDLARQRQQGYEESAGPKTFLAASRGFGDIELKRLPYRSLLGGASNTPILTAAPEVSVVDLCPADWAILLVGRGVSNVLSDQEVADVCLDAVSTKGKGPVEAAKTVTARAMQRGSKDNLTCIMMRFGWTQPPPQKTLAELLTAAKAGYG